MSKSVWIPSRAVTTLVIKFHNDNWSPKATSLKWIIYPNCKLYNVDPRALRRFTWKNQFYESGTEEKGEKSLEVTKQASLPFHLFSISLSSHTLSVPPPRPPDIRKQFSWHTCWGSRLICYKWEAQVCTAKVLCHLQHQNLFALIQSEQLILSWRKL